MCKSYYKGKRLDGKCVEVSVQNGVICHVEEIRPDNDLPYILPPLVDLQHNGALGYAYNNINEDAESQLKKISRYLIENGVGRVLATFTTAPYDLLTNNSAKLGNAIASNFVLAKMFSGIFHEGVFISSQYGWRGGHKPEYILKPDWEKFKKLNENSGNLVKMINIAPEEPGALEFITKAVEAGITVSLGHCCPDTGIINEAVARGATMVTHFGNGAAPNIKRFKNPFWGILANDNLSLGLIGDGFHLPPEFIKTALKVKGHNNCFMVSDANLYSGCKPGLYQRLGGCDCVIEENGFIHLPNEDILAGAWFQNNKSVEFLVNEVGISFEEAWRLCSVTPAKLLNIELPQIQKNEEASFVLANFCNEKLHIMQSVFCGQEYIDQ